LFGDIRASKLVIEEGATFVGKCEVNPNKVFPAPLPAAAATTKSLDPLIPIKK
jgi:cytoskeletal protein CcmA (bactofilin family)